MGSTDGDWLKVRCAARRKAAVRRLSESAVSGRARNSLCCISVAKTRVPMACPIHEKTTNTATIKSVKIIITDIFKLFPMLFAPFGPQFQLVLTVLVCAAFCMLTNKAQGGSDNKIDSEM
ncbi:hypothetical protein K438DRAFT_1775826 [Mycena galopus ATCC 62051]|nr:hypothetical protein K438DRAFT_1775826 [Mycena galopus ATCC 62051]